jgi:hypothetical protein
MSVGRLNISSETQHAHYKRIFQVNDVHNKNLQVTLRIPFKLHINMLLYGAASRENPSPQYKNDSVLSRKNRVYVIYLLE